MPTLPKILITAAVAACLAAAGLAVQAGPSHLTATGGTIISEN
ncbi:MAG TPA: hypothetical protein VMU51_21380 [Mycobacteriales bacterium]|nr:hypothetical protein [Mycobacteriales bacterium]